MDGDRNVGPVHLDITGNSVSYNSKSSGSSSAGKMSGIMDSDHLSGDSNVRESFDSVSSSALSGSQSLRESSECSLDSLNQDLPPHMQLVPFSGKSITEMARIANKKQKKDKKGNNGNVNLRKNLIQNVCTPQAVPLAVKADPNFDLDDLVQSLPKLKVTTPARIHDDGRGAFSKFATPPRHPNVICEQVNNNNKLISNSCERNPVDIEPILSLDNDRDAGIPGCVGNILTMNSPNMFRNNGGSGTKTHGSAFCQSNQFDLNPAQGMTGTLLFKAQRSLFADPSSSPVNNGLSDSLLANVGSPSVVFEKEQFSPNLSFIATSPSNDSDSSFIMPSQNTDCDYLIRRISYDPTVENMTSTNSSKSETLSKVNIPCSIEEQKESPEKVSPQKRIVGRGNSNNGGAGMIYEAMCLGSPQDSKKQISVVAPIPKLCMEVIGERQAFITQQLSRAENHTMSNTQGPSPWKAPRTTSTPGVKAPWKPSGRVKYTLTPNSEMITRNLKGTPLTPVRKINFGQSAIPRYMASTLSSQRNSASSDKNNCVQQDLTPRKKMAIQTRAVEGTPAKCQGSQSAAPRTKLSVYRRGTPRNKTAARQTKAGGSHLAGWTEKTQITAANDKSQGTPRHEESILLEEKRAQLRHLQEAKAKLAAKLEHRSPVAGVKRPLSSPVTLPAKRHPLVPTLSENLPRFRSMDHLALGEKELEAVTKLHTLCNSQQTTKFVTKPRTANVTRNTSSPREAVKIHWKEELIAEEDIVHSPRKCLSPAARPILSERAPDQLFPYCDKPSSPVVIRRSGKKTSSMLAPARLAF